MNPKMFVSFDSLIFIMHVGLMKAFTVELFDPFEILKVVRSV